MVRASLCVVYPVLGAIYRLIPSSRQSLFVVVFPLAKIVFSNAAAFASRNMVESIPGITLMSVELFNALYVAKSMQNAGSQSTYIVSLAVDMFESTMAYRDIRSRVESLEHRICVKPEQTLSQRVVELCLEPGVLRTSSIQLRSLMKIAGTTQNKIILERLEGMGAAQSSTIRKNAWTPTTPWQCRFRLQQHEYCETRSRRWSPKRLGS